MPLSIQDLIKVVEKAKVRNYDITADKVNYFIDADILLAELKKRWKNDMETQHPEWILNLLKAHSGEPLLVQVAAEAVRRRDAEILKEIEGMHQHVVKHNLFAPANVMERRYARGFNAALDQISEIIKGE